MVEAVINTQIKSVVQFHDVLQDFCAGREMMTAIIELKLAQELVSVDHDSLFLVLLDLGKVHINVDW